MIKILTIVISSMLISALINTTPMHLRSNETLKTTNYGTKILQLKNLLQSTERWVSFSSSVLWLCNISLIAEEPQTSTKQKCPKCSRLFVRSSAFREHLKCCTKEKPGIVEFDDVRPYEIVKRSLDGFLVVFARKVNLNDVSLLFKNDYMFLQRLFKRILEKMNAAKIQLVLYARFKKSVDGVLREQDTYLCSVTKPFTSLKSFKAYMDEAKEEIEELVSGYTERGSGWVLDKITRIEVKAGTYRPHKGGCDNCKLPFDLANKKSLVSIKTKTDCFMYSVLAALHNNRAEKERRKQYDAFIERYDFSDVRGDDVSIEKVKRFIKKNKISVNVYTQSHNKDSLIVPLLVSPRDRLHVNLFLYKDHYYWISSFKRLVGSKESWQRYFCQNCMSGFSKKEYLVKHISLCTNPQRVILPQPDSAFLKYEQYDKQVKYPYIAYADFETLARKTDSLQSEYQLHQAISFGIICVDYKKTIVYKEYYTGKDCAERFLQTCIALEIFVKECIKKNTKPLRMSEQDEQRFLNSTHCHICNGPFVINDAVRDHDHFTGEFRGAAHSTCNISFQVPYKLPVVFHNLKGFDAHLIIQAINKDLISSVTVIPQTVDKYIAFFMDNFVFIDSLAFLPSSLEALADNVDIEQKRRFLLQEFELQDIDFCLAKGFLPYDYLENEEKLNETSLPPKECFYNKLRNKKISDPEFTKALQMWDRFGCTTLGSYLTVYLKIDVLLLAAIFEQFRSTGIREFDLDPAKFFSTPGFTWAAALKYTKIEAHLLTDIDAVLLFERGIRGGISGAIQRYAKANIPGSASYDPSKSPSFITYLDVNNLYGYCLSQNLPFADFEWIKEDEFEPTIAEILLSATDQDEIG